MPTTTTKTRKARAWLAASLICLASMGALEGATQAPATTTRTEETAS